LKVKAKIISQNEIQEILDNFTVLSSLAVDANTKIGIVNDRKIVTSDEGLDYQNVEWIYLEAPDSLILLVHNNLRDVLSYLKQCRTDGRIDLGDPKEAEFIQSLMAAAMQAAHRFDDFLGLVQNVRDEDYILKSGTFKRLKDFYVKEIVDVYPDVYEGSMEWQKRYAQSSDALDLNLDKVGLNDLDALKMDLAYELFYVMNPEGEPYFNDKLLENIQLLSSYDEATDEELLDDPILRMPDFIDKDRKGAADQIIYRLQNAMKKFYSLKELSKKEGLSSSIHKIFMALFLARNPKNLIQNTDLKSCQKYFEDLLTFIREAVSDEEYQYTITYSDEAEEKSRVLVSILHEVIHALFYRRIAVKEELMGFIYRLIHGAEKKESKRVSFFEKMMSDDDELRQYLKKFPNGPLFKVLDLVRQQDSFLLGFDPIFQNNHPCLEYDFETKYGKTEVLHLPTPTHQEIISEASIIPEFHAFLRKELEDHQKGFLIVNLNNKCSWRGESRSHSLERLRKRAEYDFLDVMTLNKDNDFYYQMRSYDLSDAEEFIHSLKRIFMGNEESLEGFLLSRDLKTPDLFAFIEKCLILIHRFFFDLKKRLSRAEREDFIEIFYQFLILKVVDVREAGLLSFSCKDGIDKGSCQKAGFFGFLNIISGHELGKVEEKHMKALFYTQALMNRERLINSERFYRTVSYLSRLENSMEKSSQQIYESFSKIYSKGFLNSLKI